MMKVFASALRKASVVLVILSAACSLHAQTTSAGGAWSTGTNWVGNVAPTPGSITANVIVNHAMTFSSNTSFSGSASTTITINSGGSVTISGGNLSTSGSGIVFVVKTGGSLSVSGTATLASSSQIQMQGGTLTVTGLTTLNSSSQIQLQSGAISTGGLTLTANASSAFTYTAGTLTLTGAGSLSLGAAETFGYTPALGIPGNATILNGSSITATSLGGQITLNNSSKITLNTGGTVTVPVITFAGSNCEIAVSSGTLTYSSMLSLTGGNLLTINSGGAANMAAVNPGSGSTLTVNSGGSLTATSITVGNNSSAKFTNAGTTTVNGSVDCSGVLTNTGTLQVNGDYTQENTANSTTSSGTFNVTGNVSALGLIQLNPGSSPTASTMTVNGTVTVNSNPWIVVGTNVSGCGTVITNYANLIVKSDVILTGSGDIQVNQNGRLVVFANVTNTSGSGHLFTVDCGGQAYVNGNVNLGSGGGNSLTNNNGSGSPTGSDGQPTIGLYVNGTITDQTTSGTAGSKSQLQTNDDPFYTYIGTIPGNPLPVTLTYFVVNGITTEGVTLKWATASELNFNYFDLERSEDGQNFTSIGQIKGHGTTSEQHTYDFVDTNPVIGNDYYRLTSVDFDGHTEIFKVVFAEFSAGKAIAIYPNPVSNGQLHIDLNFSEDSQTTVVITDMMGTTKLQAILSAQQNLLPITLDMGLYIVSVRSAAVSTKSRLLVK